MAMNSGIFLSGSEQKQLEVFAKSTQNKREYRAATGVLMRAKGKSAEDVGRHLGITRKQVFMWCRKFRKNGVGGLRVIKQSGRPAISKNKAKDIIPQLLKEDPQFFGYLKSRWALRDISRELKREGINLHYTGVRRALRELGFVLKQPKLRAPGSIKKNYRKRAEITHYKSIAPALLKKA